MKKQTFKKNIELKTGNVLELEFTQEFLNKVQEHFELDSAPTDDQIRVFIRETFKNAIEKTENNA